MNKQSLLIFFSIFLFRMASAQENDAGLWLTASIEKKINKNLKLTLSEELRFKENYTQLGTYFTEIGLQYKISKSFNTSFNYRFIQKQRVDLTYATRNRFYLDIAYRYKADKWIFSIRTRFQDQIKSVSLEQKYSDPQFYWRNKFVAKYAVKKFTPYAAFEIFYPMNNPKGNEIDEYRLFAGTDYELNKKNMLGGYFLFDKEFNVINPVTSYIIGIEYGFSF